MPTRINLKPRFRVLSRTRKSYPGLNWRCFSEPDSSPNGPRKSEAKGSSLLSCWKWPALTGPLRRSTRLPNLGIADVLNDGRDLAGRALPLWALNPRSLSDCCSVEQGILFPHSPFAITLGEINHQACRAPLHAVRTGFSGLRQRIRRWVARIFASQCRCCHLLR